MHLRPVDSPRAWVVLGHGAGGGVESPDLVGAAQAAGAASMSVALVEQPYRVAGRRSPAPAVQLDAAWLAVIEQLELDAPLVAGGRSSGARVACRKPEKSRLDELDSVTVPTLVVQGESDPFGTPPPGPNRTVVRIPGTHSLRNSGAVAEAISEWLARLGW